MYVVGLTGGIGSGKSAVAEEFARLGVIRIDTDAIAHELTAIGGAALPEIERVFGKNFMDGSGAMHRDRMRELVFAEPAARKRLEALLHPMIRAESARRIAAAAGPYVIHVVPLLLESADYRGRVDRILVVDCPEDAQIARVRGRGLAESEILQIMAAQTPRAARLAAADDVIDNSGPIDALRKQVGELHARYLKLAQR